MTSTASLATIAEYFRLGLHAGLLQPKQASAWAASVIRAMDASPGEIIEVCWSQGLATALEALSSVPGERDKVQAGRWLLGHLRDSLLPSDNELTGAMRRAVDIARLSDLGDETRFRFEMLEDELSLAFSGAYGTVPQCRAEFLDQLAQALTHRHRCAGA